MKFININPGGNDRVWRDLPGTDFRAQLKIPTVEELQQVPTPERRGAAETRRFVASRFFLDFEGAVDGEGKALENTLAVRTAMLDHPPLWNWVNEQLVDLAKRGDEGNAGAASV